MVQYTASKPPSMINLEWIFWSKSDFEQGLTPDEVSSIIFITRKKEVCVIYKPTPISNDRNEFISIIGNMFDESSAPAFFKIDKDEIGSCYAIRDHNLVPTKFQPKIALQSDSVKDTDWEDAQMEIALIAIPTLVLISYGKEITSTTLDDIFIEEMKSILLEHSATSSTSMRLTTIQRRW